MLNWKDVWVQQERYKDLLHEAERDRLVRQALARHKMDRRFHCQTLIWLGRQLVACGWHLQKRYGACYIAEAQSERSCI